MRLIDADAFDERVRAAGGMSEEELSEDFKDGVLAVLYMMSKQPTITAQPEKRTEERTETHACDCVSRQAVQEIVDRIGGMYPYRQIGNRDSYSQYNEAWTDAINRVDAELNSLPSAQSTMGQVFDDDCVSRQAALECLEWHYPDALPATKIKELPSVKPERPKGEWITDDLSGIISCSRCGNNAPMETTGGGQYKSKFCPDCGADMRGEQIKELLETDVVTVFEALKAAHDKIKEWSKRSEQDE